MAYRDNYSKSYNDLLLEELKSCTPITAQREAKTRLRMYANLYTRDLRPKLINKHSKCVNCNSVINLQLDHIIPISKEDLNVESNIQILCNACNRSKSDKIM